MGDSLINKNSAKALIAAVDNIRESYGRDPSTAAELISVEIERALAQAHVTGLVRAAIICREAGSMALYQELNSKAVELEERYHL